MDENSIPKYERIMLQLQRIGITEPDQLREFINYVTEVIALIELWQEATGKGWHQEAKQLRREQINHPPSDT